MTKSKNNKESATMKPKLILSSANCAEAIPPYAIGSGGSDRAVTRDETGSGPMQ
jgi:hypothetical protein